MTIVTEKLSRSFGEIQAVKGIDLHVERGETFGFLGPNGAGKSTTIKMLCTLLHPTSGRAWINGYDIEREAWKVRQSLVSLYHSDAHYSYMDVTQRGVNLSNSVRSVGLTTPLLYRTTTIFPLAPLDSIRRWASAICSNGNTFAGLAL